MPYVTFAIPNVIYFDKRCQRNVAAGPQMNYLIQERISISNQNMYVIYANLMYSVGSLLVDRLKLLKNIVFKNKINFPVAMKIMIQFDENVFQYVCIFCCLIFEWNKVKIFISLSL